MGIAKQITGSIGEKTMADAAVHPEVKDAQHILNALM